MTTINTTVQGGICGSVTNIRAECEDSQNVTLHITTTCQNIQTFAKALPESIDAYNELGKGYDGAIWSAARSSVPKGCAGCVVPAGCFKSMQVAASLALPADAAILVK